MARIEVVAGPSTADCPPSAIDEVRSMIERVVKGAGVYVPNDAAEPVGLTLRATVRSLRTSRRYARFPIGVKGAPLQVALDVAVEMDFVKPDGGSLMRVTSWADTAPHTIRMSRGGTIMTAPPSFGDYVSTEDCRRSIMKPLAEALILPRPVLPAPMLPPVSPDYDKHLNGWHNVQCHLVIECLDSMLKCTDPDVHWCAEQMLELRAVQDARSYKRWKRRKKVGAG